MDGFKKKEVFRKLEPYEMSIRKLGIAVIFNNENFDDHGFEKRKGTEKDAADMEQLLNDYGFQTKSHSDFTQVEAIQELKKLSEERNYEEDNCFLAVFLSHGESDRIFMKDGQLDVQRDILDRFRGNKCKTLIGKPKIFIFQACRGTKKEDIVSWDESSSNMQDDVSYFCSTKQEKRTKVVTPAGADFLVCYAAANGYVSYRNEDDGSWFIQNFVEVMKQYRTDLRIGNEDFATLMTLVAKTVASLKGIDKDGAPCMQIPCTVSTLRNKLFLPRRIQESSMQVDDYESE